MIKITCHRCGVVFHAQRKTAKFCGDPCRNAHRDQTKQPQNRCNSPCQKRREDEFFDRHMRMCETYYGLPPAERPSYLYELVKKARRGDRAIGRMLTNRVLLRPKSLRPKVVHFRASENYPTLAQEAHRFCKLYFGTGVARVIDDPALEPLIASERHQEGIEHCKHEERVWTLQNRILPCLGDRPHHVLKAVMSSLAGASGPEYRDRASAG